MKNDDYKKGYAECYNAKVKCANCEYYYKDEDDGKGLCDNNRIYKLIGGDFIDVVFEPDEDFWCAYAERKLQ